MGVLQYFKPLENMVGQRVTIARGRQDCDYFLKRKYSFSCHFYLRGHVNKKKFKKSKKTLEGGGWVKCPIGYKKNWKKYFYALFPLVLASIRTSIINAPPWPLCIDCLL